MANKDRNSNNAVPDIVKAAYDSKVELVADLLARGENPNSVDPADNLSLLHIACMQGDRKLVDVLLQWDAHHGNLDYSILSAHRPRLAWQYAANANFLDLAERVHEAGLTKDRQKGHTFEY